jgi:hypothetical protein
LGFSYRSFDWTRFIWLNTTGFAANFSMELKEIADRRCAGSSLQIASGRAVFAASRPLFRTIFGETAVD